jgi:hypothetical protein
MSEKKKRDKVVADATGAPSLASHVEVHDAGGRGIHQGYARTGYARSVATQSHPDFSCRPAARPCRHVGDKDAYDEAALKNKDHKDDAEKDKELSR